MTEPHRPASAARQSPRPMGARPMLMLALKYGAIFALAVAVVAGLIGLAVSGVPGLLGGLLGALVAAVYLGLTAITMLVAYRLANGDLTSPIYFGTVMGAWLLKVIVFVVVVLLVGSQKWVDGRVMFFTIIVAVLGSLILDCVAYMRARVPYVDVELPSADAPSGSSTNVDDDRDARP
ncbi:hypothetical protein [Humibacter antri]